MSTAAVAATAATSSRGIGRGMLPLIRSTGMHWSSARCTAAAGLAAGRSRRPAAWGTVGARTTCAALRGFGSGRALFEDGAGKGVGEKGAEGALGEAAESKNPPAGDESDIENSEATSTGSTESDLTSVSDLGESHSETDISEATSFTSEGSDSTIASEPGGSRDAFISGVVPKASRASFAFAFDIDGVLLHKADPIPGAKETLKFLYERKIPFIFLTNGGGKPESERVAELSAKLEIPLDVESFVQSHTPMQLLASDPSGLHTYTTLPLYLGRNGLANLKDSTILVLGSDASQARRIANGYGFKSVVTPGDILKANPDIFPFDPLPEYYSKQEILPLPKPIYNPKASVPMKDCLKIDAILVFNDPRDWAVDIQLIIDLLTSHRGYLGTYSPDNGTRKFTNGANAFGRQWQNDGQPALIYSNQDMLWSTGYHQPRFGQGAFRAAVIGAWGSYLKQAHTAPRLPITFEFGKPELATYKYANQKLVELFHKSQANSDRGSFGSLDAADSGSDNHPPLKNVYMVGDNPESDIRGAIGWRANLAKREIHSALKFKRPLWQACLVRTGVWNEDKVPLADLEKDKIKPDTVQADVKAVVNWVLEKEGWAERVE